MKAIAYPSGATLYEIPRFVDDRGALNVLEIPERRRFAAGGEE